ncbi:CD48 antigen-like isoform X2 [Onychostoma macrolepis]|uniref:CD48 antigen-like isoform X2 n=1 Tax=Onychostoma macrolepis TaxID=369639 RepID=UPI00272A606B|nr:CD48 antigen-like isoform X2 [Onychostoma macrolepis]
MFLWSLLSCFICIHDVKADAIKIISVMEGDAVTLDTDFTNIQRKDAITWKFGESHIAEVNKHSLYTYADERFRDRLKMHPTGSLTIKNIRFTDSGYYTASIGRSRRTSQEIFRVIVDAPLPVPEIISNSSQCSSSSSVSRCVLLCSVVNVSHVTLSWYKGNSLLSSISVSDLSISLSLPLEVEYQEKNTYSCVINNPISNQTKHLNTMQLCQPCSSSVQCCSFTEAVFRLVVSALVIMAAVAVLVDHFRSIKVEQKMRKQPGNGQSPSGPQ